MKKNLFTKVTAFALSAAMSVTLLSGCGSKVSDKDEQGRTVISIGAWTAPGHKDLDAMNKRREHLELEQG